MFLPKLQWSWARFSLAIQNNVQGVPDSHLKNDTLTLGHNFQINYPNPEFEAGDVMSSKFQTLCRKLCSICLSSLEDLSYINVTHLFLTLRSNQLLWDHFMDGRVFELVLHNCSSSDLLNWIERFSAKRSKLLVHYICIQLSSSER